MQTRRTTWTVGGVGLIVCGVLGIVQYSLMDTLGATGGGFFDFIGELPYAAMVLLFAIGLSREASVVGRKPLGMTALIVLAIWPVIASVFQAILIREQAIPSTEWTVFSYLDLFIRAASGLIAATQIARAGIVPSPWRWAPMWLFGLHAALWAIPQILIVAVGSGDVQHLAGLFVTLSTVTTMAETLGLGVIALMLALQLQPEGVEVYRSPAAAPATHPVGPLHDEH